MAGVATSPHLHAGLLVLIDVVVLECQHPTRVAEHPSLLGIVDIVSDQHALRAHVPDLDVRERVVTDLIVLDGGLAPALDQQAVPAAFHDCTVPHYLLAQMRVPQQ
jgi:hypothetical protein